MGGGTKRLPAALVALLLVVGLVACGGDDDSTSTTGEAAAQAQSGSAKTGNGGSPKDKAENGEKGATPAGSSDGSPRR